MLRPELLSKNIAEEQERRVVEPSSAAWPCSSPRLSSWHTHLEHEPCAGQECEQAVKTSSTDNAILTSSKSSKPAAPTPRLGSEFCPDPESRAVVHGERVPSFLQSAGSGTADGPYLKNGVSGSLRPAKCFDVGLTGAEISRVRKNTRKKQLHSLFMEAWRQRELNPKGAQALVHTRYARARLKIAGELLLSPTHSPEGTPRASDPKARTRT